jgi:toxin HigB-1
LILSFGDAATEDLYHGRQTARVRRFPANIIPAALRKLDMLARAYTLIDLRAPPGNRLEARKGDWEGFHSIRINDQWRIVFQWEGHDASEVAIVDYHS